MKLQTAIAILILSLSLPITSKAAVQITDFSTTSFTVDWDFSTFSTINVNSTNIHVGGTDLAEILYGTFDPVDITGLTQISLTGILSGDNPDSFFEVWLFDNTLTAYRAYSGHMSSFGNTSSSVVLTFESESSPFDEVGGFYFVGAGLGSPLNFTFEAVTAESIPEPSLSALIILGLGGLCCIRRRRRSTLREAA